MPERWEQHRDVLPHRHVRRPDVCDVCTLSGATAARDPALSDWTPAPER
jgi:hypothetical protein